MSSNDNIEKKAQRTVKDSVFCDLFEKKEITRIYGASQAKEGAIKGANERAREVAKRMIDSGELSLEKIAQFTDLPLEEIEKLANIQYV